MSSATSGVAFDSGWFRQVLGQFPTGVCVITAIGTDGKSVGLSVGSFTSLSLDPPLVAFMPDKKSSTWPKIRAAGAFCVNILSSDQETLCRQLASKAPDKFQGVSWRPAGSGSPIIDGVVAWIDCDLERVDDAGDHEIVIGRVRELDVGADALPLLFFQGGYGHFTSLSMMTRETALSEHLRIVDLARPHMDEVAAALAGQVTAMSIVGDDIVLLASAGGLEPGATWSIVGQRLPAVPPIGSLIIAWSVPARIDTWLRRVTSEHKRDDFRRRLDQARLRGYSVQLDSPDAAALSNIIDRRRMPTTYEQLNPDQRAMLDNLPIDPLDFSPDQAPMVTRVFVPVFAADGSVPIALGVRPARRAKNSTEFRIDVEQMLRAARNVTEEIGGSVPDSPNCR